MQNMHNVRFTIARCHANDRNMPIVVSANPFKYFFRCAVGEHPIQHQQIEFLFFQRLKKRGY